VCGMLTAGRGNRTDKALKMRASLKLKLKTNLYSAIKSEDSEALNHDELSDSDSNFNCN